MQLVSGTILNLPDTILPCSRQRLPRDDYSLVRNALFNRSDTPFAQRLPFEFSADTTNEAYEASFDLCDAPERLMTFLRETRNGSFASAMSSVLSDAVVYDLGSATPDALSPLPIVAEFFGAAAYVGMDLHNPVGVTHRVGIERSDFSIIHIQSDILSGLGKLSETDRKMVFHLSGLEPLNLMDISDTELSAKRDDRAWMQKYAGRPTVAYADRCLEYMHKVSPKVSLLIGSATYGFYPQDHGFRLRHVGHYRYQVYDNCHE